MNGSRITMRAANAAAYTELLLPRPSTQTSMEIPLKQKSDPEGHPLIHGDVHPESGKINDELRYSIIDAVYLRPAIWDHGREPKSLGQRKDHFIEIAALLSTESNILSCYDIEKQWKNLKDTYFKTKKKLVTDESGCIVPPRWKFFSAMMFLDQLGNDQGTNATSRADSVLGKRNADRKLLQRRSVESSSVHCADVPRTSSTTKAGPELCHLSDDEYTVFCNSLIYPLREIGSISRVELLKLQKEIRDAVHEKQMALLQSERH